MSSAPHIRLNPDLIRLSAYPHFLPFSSFQLHENCRVLQEYTLTRKKKAAQGEGPSFERGPSNFPTPRLSSLEKLVSGFLFFPAAGL